jgi:hypothetical protein
MLMAFRLVSVVTSIVALNLVGAIPTNGSGENKASDSPLTASLILGTIWAVWHLRLYYGAFFHSLTTTFVFLTSTICYTILMTVMFLHTRGSVLMAILMHWSINSSKLVVASMLPSSRPPDNLAALLNLSALVFVTVVVSVLFCRDLLQRSNSTE